MRAKNDFQGIPANYSVLRVLSEKDFADNAEQYNVWMIDIGHYNVVARISKVTENRHDRDCLQAGRTSGKQMHMHF